MNITPFIYRQPGAVSPTVSSLMRTLTVVALVLGLAESLSAQTIWSGQNSQARTTFQRQQNGRWTEVSLEGSARRNFSFAEQEMTNSYITLYDASRDVWVLLNDNQAAIFDYYKNQWVKMYDGGWENLPSYKVRFTKMYVRDDKEGGSGDWRLHATAGFNPESLLVSKWEGGSGATLVMRRPATFTVDGPRARISARVHEHDGGIGAKWESVGSRDLIIARTGEYFLEFNNSEGHVLVYFSVLSPSAP